MSGMRSRLFLSIFGYLQQIYGSRFHSARLGSISQPVRVFHRLEIRKKPLPVPSALSLFVVVFLIKKNPPATAVGFYFVS